MTRSDRRDGNRYSTAFRRGALAGRLLAALLIGLYSTPVLARPMSEAAARGLIARYLELHNRHQLDQLMQLYASDATFQLSNGRPLVRGRTAIRELEFFDVQAGSLLQPRKLTFSLHDGMWHVGVGSVIERSAIFRALGLPVVRTQSVRDGFVLGRGKIAAIIQPELLPACARVAASGFAGLVEWLRASGDHRAATLVHDGDLHFEPATIGMLVAALGDWRAASGWRPDPALLLACTGS